MMTIRRKVFLKKNKNTTTKNLFYYCLYIDLFINVIIIFQLCNFFMLVLILIYKNKFYLSNFILIIKSK